MTDLTVDPERAEWLRALRSMNDAYVLRLLDEHTQRTESEASMKALTWAQQVIYGKHAGADELDTLVPLRVVIEELSRMALESNDDD